MSNSRTTTDVGIALALARLQKIAIRIQCSLMSTRVCRKMTYSADLWRSAAEYLLDNLFFNTSAELVLEKGFRRFVQNTLSPMPIVFHRISLNSPALKRLRWAKEV